MILKSKFKIALLGFDEQYCEKHRGRPQPFSKAVVIHMIFSFICCLSSSSFCISVDRNFEILFFENKYLNSSIRPENLNRTWRRDYQQTANQNVAVSLLINERQLIISVVVFQLTMIKLALIAATVNSVIQHCVSSP